MTTPTERYNSLLRAECFLVDLLNPRNTPRVPKAVRERAAAILRHFPARYDIICGVIAEDYAVYAREKNAKRK